MWLLTTFGRPEHAQACLDACRESGMTQKGIVIIDHPHDGYDNLKAGDNWMVWRSAGHMNMAPTMNFVLKHWPEESFYGWIADDMRPRTPGWDVTLSEVAGKWFMTHCDDLDLARI